MTSPTARVSAREHLLPTAAYVVYGERCRSARKAVSHYRDMTHDRQRLRGARLADRTPIVRGKTCRWARHAAAVWRARARAARVAYERWQRTVGLVVERLERGIREAERLHGVISPMRGTAATLERVARRHRVSPYFVLAVAMTESSMGARACRSNRKNVWGLSSCGPGWHVPTFGSWAEAFVFFARYVNGRYPGHSSPWSFRGYAACSECWAQKVSHYMGALFGVPASTRYP